MSDSVRPHRQQPTRLLCPWNFPGKNNWNGLPFPSPRHACMLSRFSHVRLCATLQTAGHQARLPTGFSRQEYWSGLPFHSTNTVLLLLLLSRFSRVRLCATPWTVAHQAPLPTGFSRQEYWTGLSFPSPKSTSTPF